MVLGGYPLYWISWYRCLRQRAKNVLISSQDALDKWSRWGAWWWCHVISCDIMCPKKFFEMEHLVESHHHMAFIHERTYLVKGLGCLSNKPSQEWKWCTFSIHVFAGGLKTGLIFWVLVDMCHTPHAYKQDSLACAVFRTCAVSAAGTRRVRNFKRKFAKKNIIKYSKHAPCGPVVL